ncbi:MAG: DUF4276 family protein [Cloacibacillus sp.]
MHFQFLIEDQSSEALILELMQKIVPDAPHITYDCKSFRGIGGFRKKQTGKETRTGKLLDDLAIYLRGFDKSFRDFQAAIFVILDNDDNITEDFKARLEQVAVDKNITTDHVFCIAVEEVEAWLLGDEAAVTAVYPDARRQVLRAYVQDSICGTWETLANVIYPGGLVRMQKECPSYREIGMRKKEWAQKIGSQMDLSRNKSPSFNYFINELRQRISPAA